jgi:hypothetical protein
MPFKRHVKTLLMYISAVAIGCVGLYYRVILLQQSDFSWLLTQAGLIW